VPSLIIAKLTHGILNEADRQQAQCVPVKRRHAATLSQYRHCGGNIFAGIDEPCFLYFQNFGKVSIKRGFFIDKSVKFGSKIAAFAVKDRVIKTVEINAVAQRGMRSRGRAVSSPSATRKSCASGGECQ